MDGCPVLGLPTIDMIKNHHMIIETIDINFSSIGFLPLEESILQIGTLIELDEDLSHEKYEFCKGLTNDYLYSDHSISEIILDSVDPLLIKRVYSPKIICEQINITNYKDEEFLPLQCNDSNTFNESNYLYKKIKNCKPFIDVVFDVPKSNVIKTGITCGIIDINNDLSKDSSPLTLSSFCTSKNIPHEKVQNLKNNKINKHQYESNQAIKQNKCSVQKTIEETVGIKSLLFPGSKRKDLTNSIDVPQKNTTIKKCIRKDAISFVAEEDYLKDPDFNEVFKDCRVASRLLYNWDFEISPSECIIIKKLTPLSISKALAVFNIVNIFITDHINGIIPLTGVGRIRIRQVPNFSSAYKVIKTMCSPQPFITTGETLHEYFFSLFPCVPRIVAMKWLEKGNPVTDVSITNRNEPCGHMLSIVLDSRAYIPRRPKNPSIKRTEAQKPRRRQNKTKK